MAWGGHGDSYGLRQSCQQDSGLLEMRRGKERKGIRRPQAFSLGHLGAVMSLTGLGGPNQWVLNPLVEDLNPVESCHWGS